MKKTIDYRRIKIKEGIDLHLLKTSKFKTTMIKIYLQEQLRKETAPMVALISYLLFRGTNNRPTTLEMMRYLEELYGADLSADVQKLGECQYLTLTLELINRHYLPGSRDLLDEGLAFILDVLTNPRTVNGKFAEDYFAQEKTVLKDDINSLFDDKSKYANQRCIQLMCPDEPFGIYKYGSIKYLEKITNEDLYSYYRNLLRNNPIHIFIVGDIIETEVVEKVEKAFLDFKPRSIIISPIVAQKKKVISQKVIEEADIRQGKLAIGYRTNITRRSPEYYALYVFNGIFGSQPHSKLFQNVREKASLAYYIYSWFDSTKGILQVSSGIESSNLEKVLQIVDEQLKAIKEGKITRKELDFTKKAYYRNFQYLLDDNEALIDSCMVEITNGLEPVLEELIKEIDKVTLEDVQAVASKIELDTIYFLKGKEGAKDEAGNVEENA
ncbi:hypothetical protein BBF96_04460 [Anoxybacter fermentans]|uniref:Peptidase M16 C-terminal domain-containing protein n=1 Tax=Anoxybacter fermentans TaxID=1323375 RepID=A0A3Q9HPI4_9FIRM|nr:pitrilysin family protein [Anoxybacter fermentans]AZR72709.1 hypothetical protein BBF96_04460 [Anoxybacter fermentans]